MRSTSGAALPPHREAARELLAARMQALYQIPSSTWSCAPTMSGPRLARSASFGRCSRRPEASWWSETQLAGALNRVSR
jgi:hypothetical protein